MIERLNAEGCMLAAFHGKDYPPAACSLFDTEDLLLTHDDELDWRFPPQIKALTETPSSVVEHITVPPDYFILTAYSAIPIADALRGYYDAAGEPTPPITYIHANTELADDFIDRDIIHLTFSAEAERLQELITDAEHICVIDEYVASGKTLTYAREVLRAASITQASAIRGKWYSGITAEEADLGLMTSTYADMMQSIGHHAYNQNS